MKSFKGFFKEEDGLAAIEYAAIAAGISLAILITVGLVGVQLDAIYERILAEIQ